MDPSQSELHRYALVLTTGLHCCHFVGVPLEHPVCFLRFVHKSARHVNAVLLDLAIVALMVVLIDYHIVYQRFLSHYLLFYDS